MDPRSLAFIAVLRTMDVTARYALAAGGIFSLLLLTQLLPRIPELFKGVSIWVSKHVIFPYALKRHQRIGPWTRATVDVHLIYIAANVFCLGFQASSVSEAGLRAETLSLINAVPLFAGAHLSFLADTLGLSLDLVRRIHRSVGWMSFSLALFYVSTVVIAGASFPLSQPQNLFLLIASGPPFQCIVDANMDVGGILPVSPPHPLVSYCSKTFV
jgi:hypothetical protein